MSTLLGASLCLENFIDNFWVIWWTYESRQVILHRIVRFLNERESEKEGVPFVLRMPPFIWTEWVNPWKVVGRIGRIIEVRYEYWTAWLRISGTDLPRWPVQVSMVRVYSQVDCGTRRHCLTTRFPEWGRCAAKSRKVNDSTVHQVNFILSLKT
jgi:hypothetical protein